MNPKSEILVNVVRRYTALSYGVLVINFLYLDSNIGVCVLFSLC